MPKTLPDLLRDGLDIVFVGINPSVFSAIAGHYFARRSNRFWPCFSASRLSEHARHGIGVERLEPTHDRDLLNYGFGFTDVAKRPTPNATGLARDELPQGAKRVRAKLQRFHPRIACFHGMTGYRPFCLAAGLVTDPVSVTLGLQPEPLGSTLLFVVPSPSGANAHCTRAGQIEWYDRLAETLQTT